MVYHTMPDYCLRFCCNTDQLSLISPSTYLSPKSPSVLGIPMPSERDIGRYGSYRPLQHLVPPCVNRRFEDLPKPRWLHIQFQGCSLTAPLVSTCLCGETTVHFTPWYFHSLKSIASLLYLLVHLLELLLGRILFPGHCEL